MLVVVLCMVGLNWDNYLDDAMDFLSGDSLFRYILLTFLLLFIPEWALDVYEQSS